IQEATEASSQMLNHFLVTKQSWPDGLLCKKLLLTPLVLGSSSIYLSLIVDRDSPT
ncbi:MAG: hypothetical protein MHPSP_004530, partial [Paramarteilia canceri]